MRITPDTNVLIRSTVGDDPSQAERANQALREASTLAIGLSCLCEFAWVLRSVYSFPGEAIAMSIRSLVDSPTVAVSRGAVEAGLAVLQSGGDFADGVIAYEGRWLGGETFVSFDRKAVALLSAQGHATHLLR